MFKLLTLFSLTILSLNCSKSSTNFPSTDFHHIVAYQMNGKAGEIINEEGKLSSNVKGSTSILSEVQVENLLKIINNKASFGDFGGRCFQPHLGFVFYKKDKKPIADLTVCFDCNIIKSWPNIGENAFSPNGMEAMKKLEEELFSRS